MNQLPRIYKRTAYHKHKNETESMPLVMNTLKNCKRGEMKRVAAQTGINYNTLKDFHRKLKDNPDFTPCHKQIRPNKRIFTIEEENNVAEFIKEEIIKPGYFFSDDDFRELIINAYLEKYRDAENIKQFNASDGYIWDFKNKYRISSKKCHIRRRPEKGSFESSFVNKIQKLKKECDNDYIINIDETSWQLFPKNILVWQNKGEDHNVCYMNKANPKDCLTVMAGISASGTKIPLMFVATGTTERCENGQLGDVHPHWHVHSESGWVTEEVFLQYLQLLREHFGGVDGKKLYLILDVYPSHRTDDVKNFAAGLNMELIFVPAGMTDEFQPLDRAVFGCLKAYAKRLFRNRVKEDRNVVRKKKDAVEDMIRAWENLPLRIIEKAWAFDEDFDN